MEIIENTKYQTKSNFIKLVIGQAVSVFGTSLLRFALSLYILDMTGRADIYATLFAVSSLPILLSPIAGAFADRFNRKPIMVGLDIANGICSLLLLIAFLLGQTSVGVIAIAMILFGFVGAVDTPIVTAIIPSLASGDKLESANGILQGVQALSGVIAPILGGILFGIFDIQTILMITTIVFFLTAFLESRILVPKNKASYTGKITTVIKDDLKEGFKYTVSHSFIRKTLLISVALNFVLVPLIIVGVPYIFRVTMNLSTSFYGFGIGVIECSTIIGALLIGVVSKKLNVSNFYRWLLGVSILLIPITLSTMPIILDMGTIPAFVTFVVSGVLLAACLTIVSIFAISKVQKITPSNQLGKVMAILMAASQCVAPIGQILYGVGFEIFHDKVYIPLLITCIATFVLAIGSKYLYKNEPNL